MKNFEEYLKEKDFDLWHDLHSNLTPYRRDDLFKMVENYVQAEIKKSKNPDNIMELSNIMFKGCKPMGGKEYEILKKTLKKSMSDKPTTLHKDLKKAISRKSSKALSKILNKK